MRVETVWVHRQGTVKGCGDQRAGRSVGWVYGPRGAGRRHEGRRVNGGSKRKVSGRSAGYRQTGVPTVPSSPVVLEDRATDVTEECRAGRDWYNRGEDRVRRPRKV